MKSLVGCCMVALIIIFLLPVCCGATASNSLWDDLRASEWKDTNHAEVEFWANDIPSFLNRVFGESSFSIGKCTYYDGLATCALSYGSASNDYINIYFYGDDDRSGLKYIEFFCEINNELREDTNYIEMLYALPMYCFDIMDEVYGTNLRNNGEYEKASYAITSHVIKYDPSYTYEYHNEYGNGLEIVFFTPDFENSFNYEDYDGVIYIWFDVG